MKINLQELRDRAEYINEQKHPDQDLIIWNYNPKCQFENAWDDYTRMARGLITDLEGNIIARPFEKFFNLGQVPDTQIENLPAEVPAIYEKLDGSLGILYWIDNLPCIATRGSFISDQAQWATSWIRKQGINKDKFIPGHTYLFEIIYPENRVVVNYGDRAELVLIAIVNNDTGASIGHQLAANELGFTAAERIYDTNIDNLVERMSTLPGNEEGFVTLFSTGLRVKFKGDEYKRLHRLITGVSTKSIWELLSTNKPLGQLFEQVPDEFYSWVKATAAELHADFDRVWNRAVYGFAKVVTLPTRKEQALEIQKSYKESSSAIFLLLDKKEKEAEAVCWQKVKPKYAKPFKIDIDQ